MFRRIKQILSRQRQRPIDKLQASKQKMLDEHLRGRGIDSPDVLRAMAAVPRQLFIDDSLRAQAYADCALPIGDDQTISQPYMVALMTQLLDVRPRHRVLEIGTGSGYQTAVLAELADEIVTVERHSRLSRCAQKTLADIGYENVTFLIGDGSLGCADYAPYDRILVTAAATEPPPSLVDQLSGNGILVGPFGRREQQELCVIRKSGSKIQRLASTPCRFVPLVGQQGFPS